MERRVHEHQRQGQDRQPDVRAQPCLRPAQAQEREFFSRVEQHGENKDRVGNDPVREAQGRIAHAVMQPVCLRAEGIGHMHRPRQRVGVEHDHVQRDGNERGEEREPGPGTLAAVEKHGNEKIGRSREGPEAKKRVIESERRLAARGLRAAVAGGANSKVCHPKSSVILGLRSPTRSAQDDRLSSSTFYPPRRVQCVVRLSGSPPKNSRLNKERRRRSAPDF